MSAAVCFEAVLLITMCTISKAATMPLFSWDRVPVFIHMCNASGPFNESTIEYLARFPIVTIEKGQGINATMHPYASLYEEDKILEALQSVKAANESVVTIAYMNSVLDWTMYDLHQEMLENPDWWLRDQNNNVVLQKGDPTFPQPEQGLYIFDYQQEVVQKAWAHTCLNLTATPYVDGCFADRPAQNAFSGYTLSANQTKYFTEGHAATLVGVQEQLNETNNSVLISNGWYQPGIAAVQLEGFAANQASIQSLQYYAGLGLIVEAHAGYKQNGDDNHCQEINNSLAAFLIGAEKFSYYGCSQGWYIEPDWIRWHWQYDKRLGEPLGKAVLSGDVYARSFASGTKVTFNITSNIGAISWAA